MRELGEGQFGKVLLMKAKVGRTLASCFNFSSATYDPAFLRTLLDILAPFQWLSRPCPAQTRTISESSVKRLS